MTLKATRNAISSPVEDCGQLQLDLLDGLTTHRSGPALAPVSRSRRPEKGSEPMIQGICGRTFIASSVPAGPLSSWESRLRERLATVGSTEFALIWREKTSPLGQSISRLAVSTRHTNGTGSIGSQWTTPVATESGNRKARYAQGGTALTMQMHQVSCWVTPSARDGKDSAGMAAQAGDRKRVDQLPRQMAQNADQWPTMTALDRPNSDQTLAKSAAFRKRNAGQNTTPLYLGEAMQRLSTVHPLPAYSPTPTVIDATGRGYQRDRGGNIYLTVPGILKGTEPTGLTPKGSPATMVKRGAPNPVFAFWLMGFPAEWISGALAAMQSYRKPRRK